MNPNSDDDNLKHLGFFRAAAVSTCTYLSTIYEAIKDQAGPLKPGVQDVEDLLKAVMRPILLIVEENLIKLLNFADKKVDEKLKFFEDHIPATVKSFASLVQHTFFQEEEKVINSKSLGTSNKQAAIQKSRVSLHPSHDTFEKIMLMIHSSGIVKALVPSAIYGAELVNHIVYTLRQKQIPLLSCIPDFPVQVLENFVTIANDYSWSWHDFEGTC